MKPAGKLLVAVCSFLLLAASFRGQARAAAPPPLKIAAFITAQAVTDLLKDDAGRQQAATILKNIGVTKVYLDTYRDGLITDPALLTANRDFFLAQGFEVSGGITTTKDPAGRFGIGSTTHRYWLCYNYPETKRDIQKVVESAAKIFNELIVDDFFATDCRCKECAAEKGGRSWPEYFRDTLVGVARDNIVRAAKKVNPKIKVIIKYPQWYDRFHVMGYDVAREPGIFDMVWVGTETRDPKKENVVQYEAFANYTWLASIGGDKTRGGWFDWINCYPEVYMEQAYQTVLAGAREIVLFGYYPKEFTADNLKLFTEKRPDLFKIADAIRGLDHRGVFAYKPPNSDSGGDTYIFDMIGMLGLPLVMSSKFPADSPSIFLSEHALADPDIAAKILSSLKGGGTIIMTSGLLSGLKKNAEIMAAAGLEPEGISKMQHRLTPDFELVDGTKIKATGSVEVAANLKPSEKTTIAATAVVDEKKYPFLLISKPEIGGKIITLNTRNYADIPGSASLTNSGPILIPNIPDSVASILRNEALAPLGISTDMPTKVGLYLYGSDVVAVENFNDSPVNAAVTFLPAAFGVDVAGLRDALTDEVLKKDERAAGGNMYIIPLAARSVRVFKVVK